MSTLTPFRSNNPMQAMTTLRTLIAGILSALVLVLVPPYTSAQTWSKEEQEVLRQIDECFTSFAEASEQNDPQIWIDRCRPADESLYWVTEEAGPMSLKMLIKVWKLTFPTSHRIMSPGFEPIRIRIANDMAFVYGFSVWYTENPDGSMTGGHGKRLEVYRRTDGLWGLYSIVWLPFDAFE